MEQEINQYAAQLLQRTSRHLKNISGDIPAFNLLSVLRIEQKETQVHSRILCHLLTDTARPATQISFLQLFLQTLDIPPQFRKETWSVCRERPFNGGANRIDFVLESPSFCIIMEIKIHASDGNHQLARYASFGRKRRKPYRIYYLTLDGHEPEAQSVEGLEKDKWCCISFQKEIIVWLQKCLENVAPDGYIHSFLMQYLGAVQHLTNANEKRNHVKDWIDSTDMAKAAQLIYKSFSQKMDDVQAQFFQKLDCIIRRETQLKTQVGTQGLDIYVKAFPYWKRIYTVTISIFYYYEMPFLVAGIGFVEREKNEFFLPLDEAEQRFPVPYRQWTSKLDSLANIPKWKQAASYRYFKLANTRGSFMNFADYSAQIELIDEMESQCRYISDTIIQLLIYPLLEEER